MIFHPDPKGFIEGSAEYGPIGAALVALARLEYSHDEFCFGMYKHHEALSLATAKTFPRQFHEKITFLAESIARLPKLWREPIFSNGERNYLWLVLQLKELYDIRSAIAHGSIFYSEHVNDRIIWSFDRYTAGQFKKTWQKRTVRMSNEFLSSVVCTSDVLRYYIDSLIRALDGSSNWELDYQSNKIILENKKVFRELVDFGILAD